YKEYCEEELFTQSLFKRMYEECPETNKSMLITQYRMPAVIGRMISTYFYDGKLENGHTTYEQLPIYYSNNLNFLDMSYNRHFYEDITGKNGVVNKFEAQLVVKIIKEIRNKISL